MTAFWLFLILGATSGGLYAICSLGLVLTYRGSGTVNFASGAIGMVGAFAYWELTGVHVPVALSMLLAIVLSGALGYITYLVLDRLRSASQLIRVVFTIVMLVTLEAIAEIKYPAANSYVVKPLFPTGAVDFLGVHVGRDRLLLLVTAAVVTAVIFGVYRYTRFGLATSAVAENPDSAAVAGWSPRLIAGANWVLGAALAGIGAILLVPVIGLSDGLAISLLVPSLAAAVVGNLTSFPITLAAGVAIGIIQTEMGYYLKSPSWQGTAQAVPFVVIALYIGLKGQGLPLRSYVGERLPRVGPGRVRRRTIVLAGVVAAALLEWLVPVEWVQATTASLIAVLPVLSLVVLTGYAGQISLAQWVIAGLGALIMAHLVVAGVGFEAATVLTLLAALPVGLLVGVASLRSRGMSLAIATLAFAVGVVGAILGDPSLNGQNAGITVGNLHLLGIHLDSAGHPQRFAIFSLIVVVGVCVSLVNIRRGRAGRRLLAVRANERAAASLGISVYGSKLAAFCYASLIATLGGILVCTEFATVVFSVFDSFTSVQLVSQGVLGGIGFVSGPFLGSESQSGTILSRAVENAGGISSYQYVVAALGLVTLLAIVQAPDGLIPMNAALLRNVGHRRGGSKAADAPLVPVIDEGDHASGDKMDLTATGLTVTLGGVTALSGVDVHVHAGKVLGVIGPNGAGKTTLIDAVSGFVTARHGAVMLGHCDVSRLPPRKRASLGIGRSFQSLELFEDMSVYENLVTACERWRSIRWLTEVFRPARPAVNKTAELAARRLGLWDPEILAGHPDALSHGTRRLVAITRSVAAEPKVLLLDEPAAGLDAREREELGDIIRWLAEELRIAVLLVEHDLDLVCRVSDELVALDHGRVICYGDPESVRADDRVVAAYLGAPSGADTVLSGASEGEQR